MSSYLQNMVQRALGSDAGNLVKPYILPSFIPKETWPAQEELVEYKPRIQDPGIKTEKQSATKELGPLLKKYHPIETKWQDQDSEIPSPKTKAYSEPSRPLPKKKTALQTTQKPKRDKEPEGPKKRKSSKVLVPKKVSKDSGQVTITSAAAKVRQSQPTEVNKPRLQPQRTDITLSEKPKESQQKQKKRTTDKISGKIEIGEASDLKTKSPKAIPQSEEKITQTRKGVTTVASDPIELEGRSTYLGKQGAKTNTITRKAKLQHAPLQFEESAHILEKEDTSYQGKVRLQQGHQKVKSLPGSRIYHMHTNAVETLAQTPKPLAQGKYYQQKENEPSVHISIGTIEVNAKKPNSAPRVHQAPELKPQGFDQYTNIRNYRLRR